MGAIEHLTIGVPVDIADKLRAWVATGEFGSMEAVVLDQLFGLEAPDDEVEDGAETTWLHERVNAAADAMDRDPSRGLPLDEVRVRFEAERIARGE